LPPTRSILFPVARNAEHGQGELLFDLQNDPDKFHNAIDEPAYADQVKELSAHINTGFSWEEMIDRISTERGRAKQFRAGRDSAPNQYLLEDGREFDAEESLYGARWLQTDTYGMSGIIPQMWS
jgi:hypothetical protein